MGADAGQLELVLDGLAFGEGPRWHDGRLWYSDMVLHHVRSVGSASDITVEAELDDRASGLGWLPDGRLLVVSMHKRQVLRRENDGSLAVHADLSHLAPSHLNDMVVAADGTAYVGNFGSDLLGGEPLTATHLIMIRPDGSSERVGYELRFPNGTVITPDDATLIVGETGGSQYHAFAIQPDGRLGEGRVWAEMAGRAPDGCTLDAEGAIWFADASRGQVVRVAEGGEVLETIDTPDSSYACALGGADGQTLFILTCTSPPVADLKAGGGRLWSHPVAVPHAGRP